jgi:glutathione synthase/RimK-type ligase-like ATP-grasp enzyme
MFEDREILIDKIENGNKYLLEYKMPSMSLEDTVVVRWGTRMVLPVNKGTVVYNRADGLMNATDKKLSRQLFIEKGVNCPELVTPDTFQNHYLPIIARPFRHSKGKNFVILRTEQDFLWHYNAHSDNWYYSNFINKDAEFRIHCAHGKVLAVMEKPRPNNDNIAWNRAQNDVDPFRYVGWNEVDDRNLKAVLIEALKAVKAVGLDFGGVDVMLDNETAYVLEVNTAPTLNSSPYVAERWGMYFDWLFRSDERREHFGPDILERQYGKSMIWKNFQLRDEEGRI